MIQIIQTENKRSRTFGWVQDPGSLLSLRDVVAVFDPASQKHAELVCETIPALVSERDGRERLLRAMNARPLRLSYPDLVGSAFSPRSAASCNGIIQAAVKGQLRPFIADWPADNFVRWAHAFGFIRYNYADDTFEITENGLALTAARESDTALSPGEKSLLTDAALAYPPAIRILCLLSEENAHLTKFEIGRQFGFVGESGFTNMPQDLLVQALASAETPEEKNQLKADWEGSADKYARMIAKWLSKLGLVQQIPKTVTAVVAGREYAQSIGQAYVITADGLTALRRAFGKSRHKRIPKRISFEMLATNAPGREYLRVRRAYLIKILSESKTPLTAKKIANALLAYGLVVPPETIRDDIQGFVNIGLDVVDSPGGYIWKDCLEDFVIPHPRELSTASLLEIKDELRKRLDKIPHSYLSLVDLAYDSKQHRLFEMNTVELLTKEARFLGLHLGGARKPDGIIYTDMPGKNYGVIIDTKAYSKGYGLPISQADEMERYIRENHTRSKAMNPAEWWNHFPAHIGEFYFLFVSGHFTRGIEAKLKRLSISAGANGAALAVVNLLLCANAIQKGTLTHEQVRDKFENKELTI